ncbi:MAG TPA: hypothetical protein VNY05_11350 [Candidatus Acidoferrales bacterium]|nr:hypothetical protein [Candidatus Acidoferrales bacterium]
MTFETALRAHDLSGPLVHSGDYIAVRRVAAGYHFAYGDGTEFLVSPEGRRVIATIPQGSSFEDTCTYLVGPVMGFVLRLRGVVCLHASTVMIDGRAVAFCGPPGAGKSTTAAAFAQRGHAIVAEDVAALDDRGSEFFVRPGYPRINLWPHSAAALCGSEEALPQITPTWGKGYLALTGLAQFHPTPAPLAAVYMIGSRNPGATPEIRELTAVDAFMALAANTYTPYLLDAAMRAREFDVLRRLVAHVPIRLVHPPEEIANIGSLCDALLQDYGALTVTEAAA